MNLTYPFPAIVGQDELKLALILNAVSPAIGGVLIEGERGTAKTTAARALAELLPEVPVVAACPLGCDPDEPADFCPHCRGVPQAATAARPAPFVDLPVGAGEDRVLGHLDLAAALDHGQRRFEPGLLFRAHRGVLYVDEVNLLPDYLVDVLLDVAASGRHLVEREGFSYRHPARFILIGTMNPEEGELRPQLIDRFGLGVTVAAPLDPEVRQEIVLRRIAFEEDADAFRAGYEAAVADARARIAMARAQLPKVRVPDDVLQHLVTRTAAAGVAGMRADIVAHRAARALAAYEGRDTVTVDDVERVLRLALHHRGVALPDPPSEPPPSPPRQETRPEREETDAASLPQEGGERLPDRFEALLPGTLTGTLPLPRRTGQGGQGGGRRLRVAKGRRGPMLGHHPLFPLPSSDVAWPATLTAALVRRRLEDTRARLATTDFRAARREDRARVLFLLLVDASGSMAAYRRLSMVKAAILALVEEAYRRRDRVSVLAFRGQEVVTCLRPTNSTALARKALAALPAGGRTPLAAGLTTARRHIQRLRRVDPALLPLLVVLSDGRANVAEGGRDPFEATLVAALAIRRLRIPTIVVDAAEEASRVRRAPRLAAALGAPLVPLAGFVALAAKEASA